MLKSISDKNILVFIILPLFVSAIFLLSITSINPAQGEITTGIPQTTQEVCQHKEDIEFKDTEEIYAFRECEGCGCADSGLRLFGLHGLEADCENMETEGQRIYCYQKHSYAIHFCSKYSKEQEIADCMASFPFNYNNEYKYYLGPSGTLVNETKIEINGWRTYFMGFDDNLEHNIMTNILDDTGKAITYRQSSRDVEFGGSLDTEGYLWVFSGHGGVYFGANPEFGLVDYVDPVKASIENEVNYSGEGLPAIESVGEWLYCSDTDNGAKILSSGVVEAWYNPGRVRVEMGDESLAENMVKEYFCLNNEIRFAEFQCPLGTLSYQGRCIDDAASRYPGMGLINPDRGSGLDVSSYISNDIYHDLWLNTNYQNTISFPDEDRNSQQLQLKKGLEVTGDVKTDRIIFQGKELIWSPPIEGDFILYYE